MSLLAPAFLVGLLAIGLPWWLHRLSSDNPNKQRFSSLMFLEPGEPRRVLAKKVQYLLLLALRIGVLVLLVLAFTEPAIWRTPQAGNTDGARLHLIVLDGSASMGYGDRWDRARAAANDVLDSMSGDDRGQIVLAGRLFAVLGPATGDVAALRQTLNTAEPGVFRLEYGQLMRSIDGLLRTAELPVVLDLVTDVQVSGLPARFGELAPRRPAEIVLHDVTDGAAENWTIDSFAASALTGELTASVRSFAPDAVTRTLALTQNGRTVAEQTVEVPAGGRAQATFAALELASGANRVEVALEPADDLTRDDRRYLSVKRPEPREVLIVAPDTEGRAALFTSAALETLTTLALTADVRTSALGDPPLDRLQLRRRDRPRLARWRANDRATGLCRKRRPRLPGRGPTLERPHDVADHGPTPAHESADGAAGKRGDRRGRCQPSRAARSRGAAGRELLPLHQRRTRYRGSCPDASRGRYAPAARAGDGRRPRAALHIVARSRVE